MDSSEGYGWAADDPRWSDADAGGRGRLEPPPPPVPRFGAPAVDDTARLDPVTDPVAGPIPEPAAEAVTEPWTVPAAVRPLPAPPPPLSPPAPPGPPYSQQPPTEPPTWPPVVPPTLAAAPWPPEPASAPPPAAPPPAAPWPDDATARTPPVRHDGPSDGWVQPGQPAPQPPAPYPPFPAVAHTAPPPGAVAPYPAAAHYPSAAPSAPYPPAAQAAPRPSAARPAPAPAPAPFPARGPVPHGADVDQTVVLSRLDRRVQVRGRRRGDDEFRRAGRAELFSDEARYSVLFALTAVWYAPVAVVFVVWVLLVGMPGTGTGARLLSGLLWIAGSAVLSLAVVGLLRWARIGWRAVTLSVAAVLIGGGVTTIAQTLSG